MDSSHTEQKKSIVKKKANSPQKVVMRLTQLSMNNVNYGVNLVDFITGKGGNVCN